MTPDEYKALATAAADKVFENIEIELTQTMYAKDVDLQLLSEKEAQIPKELVNFYKFTNGGKLSWEAPSAGIDEYGSCNILPIVHLFDVTAVSLSQFADGILINDNSERVIRSGFFRPVDFFVDEACVGYFSDGEDINELFYYDFGISFYSLKLDFEGYFKLMAEVAAYAYWQQALLVVEYNYPTDIVQKLKTGMGKLFPQFDWETFVQNYQKLKIKV